MTTILLSFFQTLNLKQKIIFIARTDPQRLFSIFKFDITQNRTDGPWWLARNLLTGPTNRIPTMEGRNLYHCADMINGSCCGM